MRVVSGPRRPAGAITLKTLLAAGVMSAGERVLTVEYKGRVTWGDLNEFGQIIFEGQSGEWGAEGRVVSYLCCGVDRMVWEKNERTHPLVGHLFQSTLSCHQWLTTSVMTLFGRLHIATLISSYTPPNLPLSASPIRCRV